MSDTEVALDAHQLSSFVCVRHGDKVYRLLSGYNKATMINENVNFFSPNCNFCPIPLHSSGRPLLVSQRYLAPFVPWGGSVAFDERLGFRLLVSTAIVCCKIGDLGQTNIWTRMFSPADRAAYPNAMVGLFVSVSIDTGGLFDVNDNSTVGPRVLYPADKEHCAAVQYAAYYFLPCVQCRSVAEFRAVLAAEGDLPNGRIGQMPYTFNSDDERCSFLDNIGIDGFNLLKLATIAYFSAKSLVPSGFHVGFDPKMWPCAEVKRCACIEAAIGLAGINMQYPETHRSMRVEYEKLDLLTFGRKDLWTVFGVERLVKDGALLYRRTVEPPHRTTTWPTEQPVAKTASVEGGRSAQWEWLPLEVAQTVLQSVLLDAYAGDHSEVEAMLKARLVSRQFARYFSSACGQAYTRVQKARDEDPTSVASIIRWGQYCLTSGIQPWLYVKWSRSDVRKDTDLEFKGDEEGRLLFNYLRTRRVKH
jgi:hypothetical protein